MDTAVHGLLSHNLDIQFEGSLIRMRRTHSLSFPVLNSDPLTVPFKAFGSLLNTEDVYVCVCVCVLDF